MKEIKIEENVKLKLSPGVVVQIASPSRCSVNVTGADHCDVSVQDSKNMTVTHNGNKDMSVIMTDETSVSVAAYHCDMHIARN